MGMDVLTIISFVTLIMFKAVNSVSPIFSGGIKAYVQKNGIYFALFCFEFIISKVTFLSFI